MNDLSAKFRMWVLQAYEFRRLPYLAGLCFQRFHRRSTGFWLMDWPPHMVGKGPRRGNILNVYTHQSFLRWGLARELMDAVLRWCRENQIDMIILHAGNDGRNLYESMGFIATNEMRLRL